MWISFTTGATDTNTKSKRKICTQSWIKYFENFWYFIKFYFLHMWNEAGLLVIAWHVRVASRVTERLKTAKK